MTLIASCRVPDGIIIAGDSMSSLVVAPPKMEASGRTKCPNCGQVHDFKTHINTPIGLGVTSTSPYSQKIQPLWKTYGVGTHGTSVIANKSIFACIREFEKSFSVNGLRKTTKELGTFLRATLKAQMGKDEFNKIPKGKYVLGFQIIGYEEGKGISIAVDVGKTNSIKEWAGFGATVAGVNYVATKLWELKGLGPRLNQPYTAWSIQDAIDYCEFLIQTTADYQRFANVIPSVGGDIDIGIVLPDNSFKWIRKKKLTSILLGEE